MPEIIEIRLQSVHPEQEARECVSIFSDPLIRTRDTICPIFRLQALQCYQKSVLVWETERDDFNAVQRATTPE